MATYSGAQNINWNTLNRVRGIGAANAQAADRYERLAALAMAMDQQRLAAAQNIAAIRRQKEEERRRRNPLRGAVSGLAQAAPMAAVGLATGNPMLAGGALASGALGGAMGAGMEGNSAAYTGPALNAAALYSMYKMQNQPVQQASQYSRQMLAPSLRGQVPGLNAGNLPIASGYGRPIDPFAYWG
jgi:hypothetical protein